MMGYGYGARPEVSLFAANGIQVTSARLVCWQQTYPIANITSVSPFTEQPNKSGEAAGIFFAVGSLLTGGSCTACGRATDAAGLVGLGVTMVVAALAIGAYSIHSARSKRPTHGVMITTAGMNVRAVTSADPAFIHAVVAALNQALSMR